MANLRSFALCCAIAAAPYSVAETPFCAPDAMLVFDGSGSMAEMGFNYIDEPRIFEARRAVGEILPQVEAFRRIGLIVYGPGDGEECAGIDLRLPPTANAAARIIADIDNVKPAGQTALTRAVAMAADALDYESRPATIVLVTDGKETCGGAPCELAAELAATGFELTVHVIGFKVRGDRFSYDRDSDYRNSVTVAQCLADRTGGHYHSTETAEELIDALRRSLGCALYL
ncbi:MAG: VWA domain-containing protein [Pseudomonadota bacterium]